MLYSGVGYKTRIAKLEDNILAIGVRRLENSGFHFCKDCGEEN